MSKTKNQKDIFEILKQDHDDSKDLLNELMDGLDELSSSQLSRKINKLQEDLKIHMKVEEETVYPELKRLEGLKDEIKDANEEHQELRDALDELTKSNPEEELLQRILGMISHHVSDEEDEIFPEARKKMTDEHYAEMSRAAIECRDKLKAKAEA